MPRFGHRPKGETDAEARERLVAKLECGTPYGIAAVLRRVSTTDEQDGWSWWFLVGDGSKTDELEANMSDATFDEIGPSNLDRSTLEAIIERRAVRYPVAVRLKDLLSENALTLEPSDFR